MHTRCFLCEKDKKKNENSTALKMISFKLLPFFTDIFLDLFPRRDDKWKHELKNYLGINFYFYPSIISTSKCFFDKFPYPASNNN